MFTRGNESLTLWSLGLLGDKIVFKTSGGECSSDPEVSKCMAMIVVCDGRSEQQQVVPLGYLCGCLQEEGFFRVLLY